MASAGARACNGGLGAEPPAGLQGAEPPVRVRGRSPPEADSILVPSTHFCAVLELVVVADLTERYDTIRDAILTCARKPTQVGLIYRTETTTKNCKREKLKSKNSLC